MLLLEKKRFWYLFSSVMELFRNFCFKTNLSDTKVRPHPHVRDDIWPLFLLQSYYRLYNKELYKREQEIFIGHRNSWYHNTLAIIVFISELSSV